MMKVPTGYRPLKSSERHPAPGAHLAGSADQDEVLSVTVSVRRRPDAPPLPDPADLASTPTGQRRFLSREEFAEHYGASQADLDRLADFARAHGLTVLEASIPKRTIQLAGTVKQMCKAFAVELNQYESPTGNYRGREGEIHLPSDLMDIVEGVFGLDNRKMARPLFHVASEPAKAGEIMAAGEFLEGAPTQAITPLTPPKMASLYNFPVSPNAAGQTIGLFEFGGGFKLADIQAYFNALQLPVPTIVTVGMDGMANSPGSAEDVEVVLDIDVAGSAAPGARIVVYFAPWTEQGWVDIVASGVHDNINRPSALSISWGWPEHKTYGFTWTDAAMQAVDARFQEAAAFGVSVLAASGDYGSTCGMGDGLQHVLYPASDPYVTACGGTVISNVSGSNFTENTWPETGGGISDCFPLPVWQKFANIPVSANDKHAGRGIPDIAGNASPSSGYILYLNGSTYGAVGGTSATAPLYAALVALLNANLREPLGFLNPNLYAFPQPYVYRDIADNVSNGAYKATAGWDCCTGLGSVIGVAMLTSLRGLGLPPAMVTYNKRLYMVWKGMEFDDRVFYSSFDGTVWAPQKQIPGIGSSTGVALAVLGNKLFMAWKGVQGDEGIYWTTFDGMNWAPQQGISGIGTSHGPRLAVLDNKLYMAWKGVMGDQRIFYSTFTGAGWAPQKIIPGLATSVGPALAAFNNALFMAWKGWNGDQGMYWCKFTGTGWTPVKAIAGTGSSEGPSLAVFQGSLYALWKGAMGDQTLWYSHFNGTVWAAQKLIPGVASSVGPGAAVFGNALYAAWKGMLSDQHLWLSHFNGSSWAAQKVGPGYTSPDLLVHEMVHG